MENKWQNHLPCQLDAASGIRDLSGCVSLGALEQHLPDIFVRSVEEPVQGLVLRRIELPLLKPRRWHGRIRWMSMTWTTLTSLSFLFTSFWMQA